MSISPAIPPRSFELREKLRNKGQFWTPDWIARAMVAFSAESSERLFDPGCGNGAFAAALQWLQLGSSREIRYAGCDTDPAALDQFRLRPINEAWKREAVQRDFLSYRRLEPGTSIVANPPYIRHHRLPSELKARLHHLAEQNLGQRLDGRAGLHAYFLLHAISLLENGQRLAFIVPSDVCEGVYAPPLWRWITRVARLRAIITFASTATPFPGVDTNPIVVLLEKAAPDPHYTWARVSEANHEALIEWIQSGMSPGSYKGLDAQQQSVSDCLSTGLSRSASHVADFSEWRLGDLISVMRGIATGANDFFFMTEARVRELGLDPSWFRRAVGRTRDVDAGELTTKCLDELEARDRPTHLLCVPSLLRTEEHPALDAYLTHGEQLGLPERPLIAQRRTWYSMEHRDPPDFLFAYLGRRQCRFIRNDAKVVPLTSYLCVYLRPMHRGDCGENWQQLLNDPALEQGLRSVAKSYGSDAIKLEPRSLERAPIPIGLIEKYPWVRRLLERQSIADSRLFR